MVLFRRRQELAEIAAAEAEGKSFWTEDFSNEVRHKLFFAMLESAGEANLEELSARARYEILKDRGVITLQTKPFAKPQDDFFEFVNTGNSHDVIDAIEATLLAIPKLQWIQGYQVASVSRNFTTRINEILSEHRIAYQVDNLRVEHLHPPALQSLLFEPIHALLSADSRLQKVDQAFRDGWEEFDRRRYSDAITDGATALQELFHALGATQDQLSAQLTHLQRRDFFASFDATLAESLHKLIKWSGAVRGKAGDTHRVSDPTRHDTQFFLTVAGAVILWLGTDRGNQN